MRTKILSMLLALVMVFTCAAALAEGAEPQVGVYTIFNGTGEVVKSITLTDNVTGDVASAETELEAGASCEMTFSIPAGEDGHHRLTLKFVTESGYEGHFDTLSIEVAPITLLSADAMTGATMISFTEPMQYGKYVLFNATGENVTSVSITDNVTGEVETVETVMAPEQQLAISYGIKASEDGHHRLTFKFVTESGYEGSFDTLSIEEAGINLISADAMTGATMIAFTPALQTGAYTVYNRTGEKVTVTVKSNADNSFMRFEMEDGASSDITFSIPASADGHGALTLSFVTEGGYEGAFETLSIEEAPITLLAEDAKTGATDITFFAPAE